MYLHSPFKNVDGPLLKKWGRVGAQGRSVGTCLSNPSYSGGRDQEHLSSVSAEVKSCREPFLNKEAE
jgi:hypothetical protein